ncbi:hypothetical protein [Lysobacter gummosus]|uniref:hypothetical protein n=1 Tax=Lysobacter gummosus TaxID=262324 RepID=UPI003628CB76
MSHGRSPYAKFGRCVGEIAGDEALRVRTAFSYCVHPHGSEQANFAMAAAAGKEPAGAASQAACVSPRWGQARWRRLRHSLSNNVNGARAV